MNSNQLIAPELLAKIRQALGRFIEMANCSTEQFYVIPENCQALYGQLRKMNIPETEWISEHVFSAAFLACQRELEKRPPRETEAQRIQRLQTRDIFGEGSLQQNVSQSRKVPNVAEKVRDLTKVFNQRLRDFHTQLKNASPNNPDSLVGTPSGSQPLTRVQMKALTATQLRKWMHDRGTYLIQHPEERTDTE